MELFGLIGEAVKLGWLLIDPCNYEPQAHNPTDLPNPAIASELAEEGATQ